MISEETLEPTLDDLVAGSGAETGCFVRDEREANLLLARILWDLMRNFQSISQSWH
jgi:hypothetical protein